VGRSTVRHPELVRAVVMVAGAVGLFSNVLSVRRIPKAVRASPGTVPPTLFDVLTAGPPRCAAASPLRHSGGGPSSGPT